MRLADDDDDDGPLPGARIRMGRCQLYEVFAKQHWVRVRQFGMLRSAIPHVHSPPAACTHHREKYDMVLISPRNYFLYTPLLPAVATGTCEERSIVEPIRRIVNGKVRCSGLVYMLTLVITQSPHLRPQR